MGSDAATTHERGLFRVHTKFHMLTHHATLHRIRFPLKTIDRVEEESE